jgi:PmbA protein
MTTIARLENVAAFLLSEAKRRGATDADVVIKTSNSVELKVSGGQFERRTACVDEHQVILRVFVGQRSHQKSISDLRRRALSKLAREVVATAKGSLEDKFAGLPDAKYLATSIPQLDLHCSRLAELTDRQKVELALKAEAAAREVSDKILHAEANFGSDGTTLFYANTRGFSGSYGQTGWGLVAKVVVKAGDDMKVGYWWESGKKLNQLGDPTLIGKTAAERAVRQIGARKIKSQTAPVIYDPLMAGRLIGQLADAANGQAIFRGSSFLVDKIGQMVANPRVTIIDDPLLPIGQASRPFAAEGLPVSKRTLVNEGKLECYFIDAYSARVMETDPNGGARSNLYIPAGSTAPEDMIKSVKSGLYLTNVSGPGYNPVNGDYSLGADGFWIENGELAYPVQEITVAGNMLEMFGAIEAIGSDLSFRMASASPSLLIGKMSIGGE